MERMDEHCTARRVLFAEVSGGSGMGQAEVRLDGRHELGWSCAAEG